MKGTLLRSDSGSWMVEYNKLPGTNLDINKKQLFLHPEDEKEISFYNNETFKDSGEYYSHGKEVEFKFVEIIIGDIDENLWQEMSLEEKNNYRREYAKLIPPRENWDSVRLTIRDYIIKNKLGAGNVDWAICIDILEELYKTPELNEFSK